MDPLNQKLTAPSVIGDDQTSFNIPVLMYHGLYDNFLSRLAHEDSPYHLPVDKFRDQMGNLAENGYCSIDLNALIRFSSAELSHTQHLNKSVVITFDDGYADNFDLALPILNDLGLHATFFVIVNRIGTPPYLSWQQLESMVDAGMNIQSHTMTHRPLESLSAAEIESELAESRSILEKRLGLKVTFFSLPHGSWSELIVPIARQLGYVGCCTSEIGYFDAQSDPFRIKRFAIKRNSSKFMFQKIVLHDPQLLRRMQQRRRYKQMIKNIIGIKNYNFLFELTIRARARMVQALQH